MIPFLGFSQARLNIEIELELIIEFISAFTENATHSEDEDKLYVKVKKETNPFTKSREFGEIWRKRY